MSILRRLRRRSERGAAMVETAIGLTLITFLSFVLIDLGVFFSSFNSVGAAAQESARAISTAGTSKSADAVGLQRVPSVLTGSTLGSLERVVVFDAPSFKATAPADCANASSPSLRCNRYVASDVDRPISDYSTGWSAPNGWPASDRRVSRISGTSLVGVTVTSNVSLPFGILGGSKHTISRTAVVQLEATTR